MSTCEQATSSTNEELTDKKKLRRENSSTVGTVRVITPPHNEPPSGSIVSKTTSECGANFPKKFSSISEAFRLESIRHQQRLKKRAALRRQIK